jgi:hypothetical protein
MSRLNEVVRDLKRVGRGQTSYRLTLAGAPNEYGPLKIP